MLNEKATAAAIATTTTTEDIVSQPAGRVKLAAYAAEKGATCWAIANALKQGGFRKCSAAAISMAYRPADTGVQLVAQAFPVLYESFGAPSRKLVKRSHAENRSKPFRVYVRFSEIEYTAFNEARGSRSAQAYAHEIIINALKGGRNEGFRHADA